VPRLALQVSTSNAISAGRQIDQILSRFADAGKQVAMQLLAALASAGRRSRTFENSAPTAEAFDD
jgi:hypothetical protein